MKHTTCWLALPFPSSFLSLSLSLGRVGEESVETVIISESLRPVWLPETSSLSPSVSLSLVIQPVSQSEMNEWMNAAGTSGPPEDRCGTWLSDACHSAVALTDQTDTPVLLHHSVHHEPPCLSRAKRMGLGMVARCWFLGGQDPWQVLSVVWWEDFSVGHINPLPVKSDFNRLPLVCAWLSRELVFNSNPLHKCLINKLQMFAPHRAESAHQGLLLERIAMVASHKTRPTLLHK